MALGGAVTVAGALALGLFWGAAGAAATGAAATADVAALFTTAFSPEAAGFRVFRFAKGATRSSPTSSATCAAESTGLLVSYSSSSALRRRLLLAGCFAGAGDATGAGAGIGAGAGAGVGAGAGGTGLVTAIVSFGALAAAELLLLLPPFPLFPRFELSVAVDFAGAA